MKGIAYADLPKIIARNGGSIVVNPLAKWGRSKIWKAAVRARTNGIVEIRRERPDRAIVTVAEPRQ